MDKFTWCVEVWYIVTTYKIWCEKWICVCGYVYGNKYMCVWIWMWAQVYMCGHKRVCVIKWNVILIVSTEIQHMAWYEKCCLCVCICALGKSQVVGIVSCHISKQLWFLVYVVMCAMWYVCCMLINLQFGDSWYCHVAGCMLINLQFSDSQYCHVAGWFLVKNLTV